MFTKSDPPLQKRRLRQISVHNVSTVRDSEKKFDYVLIESRSRAFQRAIDGVRTLLRSPLKSGAKSDFFRFFWSKSQLQSNKVCYKVSLCENFHRQSCKTVNQL